MAGVAPSSSQPPDPTPRTGVPARARDEARRAACTADKDNAALVSGWGRCQRSAGQACGIAAQRLAAAGPARCRGGLVRGPPSAHHMRHEATLPRARARQRRPVLSAASALGRPAPPCCAASRVPPPLPSPPTVRYGRRSCATVTCLSACPPSRDRRRRLSAARDPAAMLPTDARWYPSILPSLRTAVFLSLLIHRIDEVGLQNLT